MRVLALAAVLAVGAALPQARAGQDWLGSWTVTGGGKAPWAEQNYPDEIAEMAKMKGLTVTFKAHEVVAKGSVVGCSDAHYEATSFPADALFQGGLDEGRQAEEAAALGFAPGAVAGFDLDCSSGLFSYHFKDRDTVLFALDNVIYTLKRQK
ncbi:hypothetical protein [Zavarzinia sp.]|uniref:hypothetical protein n=1 Tax=Zavarzinia sp. TaxID=2027920 RepID=UPI003562ACF3